VFIVWLFKISLQDCVLGTDYYKICSDILFFFLKANISKSVRNVKNILKTHNLLEYYPDSGVVAAFILSSTIRISLSLVYQKTRCSI